MFERRSDLVKLLAVVDTERIVTAAHRLAMTQPALSRVVARLEREFSGRLFERIPAGVRLTALGAVVAERARRILHEIEDGEETVAAALAGRTARFRITAPPLWMQAVLAPAANVFHAAFPEIEFKLRTAAWLPLNFLEALPGAPLAPLPLAFARHRYRTGFVVRRSAEDLAPFRQLQKTVREVALEREGSDRGGAGAASPGPDLRATLFQVGGGRGSRPWDKEGTTLSKR